LQIEDPTRTGTLIVILSRQEKPIFAGKTIKISISVLYGYLPAGVVDPNRIHADSEAAFQIFLESDPDPS